MSVLQGQRISEPAETEGSDAPFDEELIIKEARRRQRHRWLGLGIATLVVIGTALFLAIPTGHTPLRTRHRIERTSPRPPKTVAVPACSPSDLSVDVGFVQASSQSWFIPLQFTNTSSAPCSVAGYPQVSLVNAQGQEVGLAIMPRAEGLPDRPVNLSHAQTAQADLWQPNTTKFIEAGQPCPPVAWSAIRITFPAAVVVSGSSGDWSKATTTCGSGDVTGGITPLHVVSSSTLFG